MSYSLPLQVAPDKILVKQMDLLYFDHDFGFTEMTGNRELLKDKFVIGEVVDVGHEIRQKPENRDIMTGKLLLMSAANVTCINLYVDDYVIARVSDILLIRDPL